MEHTTLLLLLVEDMYGVLGIISERTFLENADHERRGREEARKGGGW